MDPKDLGAGKIHLSPDLESYFQEQVQSVAQKQGIAPSPFAAQYLGRVLSRFANTQNFMPHSNSEGRREVPTLALLWLEGQQKNPTQQYFQMQFLGDVALFTSGFFSNRIKGSVVDVDYYRAMGGQAYERAAQLRESIASEKALNVFFELSGNFAEFVEVFAEIADQAFVADDKNLLKLYERWLVSRSDRMSRILAEHGVIAAPGSKGSFRNEN